MTGLLFGLVLLFVVGVKSVAYSYDVDCPANAPIPCGAGGAYTLKQTAPSQGSPTPNQNIQCAMGDTVTFNILNPIPGHPFSVLDRSNNALPNVPQSTTNPGTVTVPCDSTLASAGPAHYICDNHAAMTGTISIGSAPGPGPGPGPSPGGVVAYQYDVVCPDNAASPCGAGGAYTLIMQQPTQQPGVANLPISCNVGDTITFNFPKAEPNHPFEIIDSSRNPYPSIPNYDASFPVTTATQVTITCDAMMMSNPARYICDNHDAMTSSITIGAAPLDNTTRCPCLFPAVLDQTAPGLDQFTNTIDLGEGIIFYFNLVSPGDTFLDFAVSGPTTGWLGIGFSRNDNFQMRGSDAFFGSIFKDQTNPQLRVSLNLLATKALDTTGIVSNPALTSVSGTGSFFNGRTTMILRRKLDEGYNPIVVDTNGQMNAMIIASYANDPTGAVNYKHDVRVEFGRYVNLRTGQFDVAYRYPIPIRVAHGIMMGTAYTVLFPLGLMVARYGKSETGTWFKAHFFLQNYAFIVMLVGIIIGYTLPEIQFASFTYHAVLGTIIFVFTVVQISMGYARPHKEKGEPLSPARRIFEFVHHWLGRIIVILAIAQIAAGIRELGVSPFAYGIWVPIVVVLFIVSVVLEIRERCFKPKSDAPFYEIFL